MKDPLEDTETDRNTALGVVIAVVVGALVLSWFNSTAFGVVLMILAIILVVMLHEAGHLIAGRLAGMKCTEYFVGFGPRIWSFKRGETEYGIKAIMVGGYVRVLGMSNLEEVDPADEDRTYRQARFRWRLTLALAGVTTNIVLCFLLAFAVFWGQGNPESTTKISAVSDMVVDGTRVAGPAKAAGLRAGDEVLSVDGVSLGGKWDAFVEAVRRRPGETVDFLVLRDGARLTVPVELASRNPDSALRVGFAGVSASTRYVSESPITAVGESLAFMRTATAETVKGFGRVFSPAGVGRQVDAVRGNASSDPTVNERPVSIFGITKIAGEGFSSDGFWFLVYFIAYFNLILALFNLLPLLPFDGGHVAVACFEQVASKVKNARVRVDFRWLMPLTMAVLAVMALLGMTSAYLDIHDILS